MTRKTLTPAEEYEAQVIHHAFQEMLLQECDALEKTPLTPEEEALLRTAESSHAKHLAHIDCLIRRHDNIRRIKTGVSAVVRYAALFLLVVSFSFGTAFAISKDFRVIVVDFLNVVTEEYVRVGQEEPSAQLQAPDGWIGEFYPTYMPEGYELMYHHSNAGYSKADYVNPTTEKITICVSNNKITTQLNAENAQCQLVAIADYSAYWYTTDSLSIITWTDGIQYYSLSATTPNHVLDVVESLAKAQGKDS